MATRHFFASILSGMLCLSFLAPARSAAEPDNGLATHRHDPFLVNMKAVLKNRAPNEDEMSRLNLYMQNHQGDPDGHLVMANAYNQLGMDGMYAEEMEKAWRLSNSSLNFLFASLKARALADDHCGYENLVEKAFQTFKNNADMLSKTGQVFLESNQSKLSLRFLSRARELNPQDMQLLCSYCSNLLALRRYRELLSAATPLFAQERTRALANLLSGTAWYNLNQPEKALPLLARAYHLAPNQPEIAESYFDALIACGKNSQALQPALVALSLQPPFAAHMSVLKAKVKPIIARAKTEDLDNGISQVAKTIPPTNSLAFFYFALGDLLDKSDRIRNASYCYYNGLTIDPSFGRAYMRLAHDWELLGGPPDKIINFYEKAALQTRDDKEVVAKYERMKARKPSLDRDIAAKVKFVINNIRYQ